MSTSNWVWPTVESIDKCEFLLDDGRFDDHDDFIDLELSFIQAPTCEECNASLTAVYFTSGDLEIPSDGYYTYYIYFLCVDCFNKSILNDGSHHTQCTPDQLKQLYDAMRERS
mgnify:CR=1 FL=1